MADEKSDVPENPPANQEALSSADQAQSIPDNISSAPISSSTQESKALENGVTEEPGKEKPNGPVTESEINGTVTESKTEQPEPESPRFAIAKVAHTAEEADSEDLHFEAGDRIRLLFHEGEGWWEGELNGKTGMFPSDKVDVIPDEKEMAAAALLNATASGMSYGEPVLRIDGLGTDVHLSELFGFLQTYGAVQNCSVTEPGVAVVQYVNAQGTANALRNRLKFKGRDLALTPSPVNPALRPVMAYHPYQEQSQQPGLYPSMVVHTPQQQHPGMQGNSTWITTGNPGGNAPLMATPPNLVQSRDVVTLPAIASKPVPGKRPAGGLLPGPDNAKRPNVGGPEPKLFVQRVGADTSQEIFKQALEEHGEVAECVVMSAGYGFATYANPAGTQAALTAGSIRINGQPVGITISKSRLDVGQQGPTRFTGPPGMMTRAQQIQAVYGPYMQGGLGISPQQSFGLQQQQQQQQHGYAMPQHLQQQQQQQSFGQPASQSFNAQPQFANAQQYNAALIAQQQYAAQQQQQQYAAGAASQPSVGQPAPAQGQQDFASQQYPQQQYSLQQQQYAQQQQQYLQQQQQYAQQLAAYQAQTQQAQGGQAPSATQYSAWTGQTQQPAVAAPVVQPTIYISGLPETLTNADFLAYFQQFGQVANTNFQTGTPYAAIIFSSSESTRLFCAMADRLEIQGSKLTIQLAPKDDTTTAVAPSQPAHHQTYSTGGYAQGYSTPGAPATGGGPGYQYYGAAYSASGAPS